MADVYDLVQKKLAQSQGAGRNQFYDPVADFAMEIPKLIQGQQINKEELEMQRFRDQNTVANQFNNTVSRFMSAYQNTDGTLSNENIGNLRKQIDTLRFQYEKQFPNSIELLGTTEDIFNSKLSQMEKDNVRYDNMNFEMNKMMGDEEGSLGSMLDKYSGLTEEYVLNNREELINELSQMTSKIGNYNKDFDKSGFNSRVGSGDLTGNMSKANTILKSLQQQLLDIDSMSPNKIITEKERLAFTQYLENDNSDLLDEIITENKAGIKSKKKQTFEAIEKNLSDYAYADSIMNLDSNKDYIASGGTLRDSEEKDTGLTFSEWEQKKNDAYRELHMGKFDEKLKNLYASGTGYMDLYSDRPAAQIINQFDDLKPLFGVGEQKSEIKTPLEKLQAGEITREEYNALLAEKLDISSLGDKGGKPIDIDKSLSPTQDDPGVSQRLKDIDARISELDTIATATDDSGIKNINKQDFDMGTITDEKNKLLEERKNLLAGTPSKTDDTLQNVASSHIDSFLNLPSSKHGNFVDSKTSKEFKENLMKDTGWSSGGANRGIQRLRIIRRLNNELQKMKEKGATDIQIQKKEEQIKNKKDEYLKWSDSLSIFASFDDKLPKMTDKEIQDFIDSKPRGQAAQGFTQDRNKAIAELERRKNKDVVKQDSPQDTLIYDKEADVYTADVEALQKETKDKPFDPHKVLDADGVTYLLYDEATGTYSRDEEAFQKEEDRFQKYMIEKNPYALNYDDYRDWLENKYEEEIEKALKDEEHVTAHRKRNKLTRMRKDRKGTVGSTKEFNEHMWYSDDKLTKSRVQKWIDAETKRRQNK